MSMLIRLMTLVNAGPNTDYKIDSSTESVLESLRSRVPPLGIVYWKWTDDQRYVKYHLLLPIIKSIIEEACGTVLYSVRHVQRGWMITLNDSGTAEEAKQMTVSRLLALRKWFELANEDIILKLRDGKKQVSVCIFDAILPEDDEPPAPSSE